MLRYLVLSFFLVLSCRADFLLEGVSLFHEKKYDDALQLFEKDETYQENPVGSLIGKVFCQIALGNLEDMRVTISSVKEKIEFQPDCKTSKTKRDLSAEQHQKAYECRQKVREITNKMRQTVEKLVREKVPGVLEKIKILREIYPFIDSLEYAGIECCQSNASSDCCLNPLLEQLENWDAFGIPPPSKKD